MNEHDELYKSLLPLATKISSGFIPNHLVDVQPMTIPGMTKDKYDKIISETKEKNRDGKINSIIYNEEFKEINPEDHPEWKQNGSIFYMDWLYKP